MKPIANQYSLKDIEGMRDVLPSVSLFTFAGGCERSHLPTALVRWFKDGRLRGETQGLHELAKALAVVASEAVQQIATPQPYTHICRALGSWEARPEATAPLELFQNCLAESLNLEIIHPFIRTQSREPMSLNLALGGSQAFRKRAWVAGQDMVLVELCPGARVLLVDDIRCLGATESVLGWALRHLGGAKTAGALSLAQMEGLEDGQTVLNAEIGRLASGHKEGGFWDACWLEADSGVLHTLPGCSRAAGHKIFWLSGVGEGFRKCGECAPRSASLLQRMRRHLWAGGRVL